jgi:hypothetical protein
MKWKRISLNPLANGLKPARGQVIQCSRGLLDLAGTVVPDPASCSPPGEAGPRRVTSLRPERREGVLRCMVHAHGGHRGAIGGERR